MAERVRRQCTATSKRTHSRCGRAPAVGATVCKWHGGNAPQTLRKAAERHAATEIATRLSRITGAPVTDPFAALQDYAGRVLAREQVIAEVVEGMSEWRYRLPAGEQRRAELAMLEAAMAESRQTLTSLAKLALDERVVQLREKEADLFAAVMAAVFRRLNLAPGVIREAERFVVEELDRARPAGRPA